MTTIAKPLSLEQETNPWEAQAARFDFAAHKLNLDEGLWKVLRHPNREIIVHIPVAMDNGTLEVFTGFRCFRTPFAPGADPSSRRPRPSELTFGFPSAHRDRFISNQRSSRHACQWGIQQGPDAGIAGSSGGVERRVSSSRRTRRGVIRGRRPAHLRPTESDFFQSSVAQHRGVH
jgi:hypothetical protein